MNFDSRGQGNNIIFIVSCVEFVVQFLLVVFGFEAGLTNIKSLESESKESVWLSTLESGIPSCAEGYVIAMRVLLILALSVSCLNLFVIGRSNMFPDTTKPYRIQWVLLSAMGFVIYLAVFITSLVYNYNGVGGDCVSLHDIDSKFGFSQAHFFILACLLGTGLNTAFGVCAEKGTGFFSVTELLQ